MLIPLPLVRSGPCEIRAPSSCVLVWLENRSAMSSAKNKLNIDERIFYRDQLRAARYAALADSEAFHEICFALESLGMRLHGKKADLGTYRARLKQLARESEVLSQLTESFPSNFTGFDALFESVRVARNDAMHTGVFARHATVAAIELCIGLEAAIMRDRDLPRYLVKHYMVKSPVWVEPWQPIAHARQLMLTHSFSFLPVKLGGGWQLISETNMARYLQYGAKRGTSIGDLLSATIEDASVKELSLICAQIVSIDDEVHTLLQPPGENLTSVPRLWLVIDEAKHLIGVLSPFELM